jgi:hypothetical protein
LGSAQKQCAMVLGMGRGVHAGEVERPAMAVEARGEEAGGRGDRTYDSDERA